MASSKEIHQELNMRNPDHTEAWIRIFSAKCRYKKLKDTGESKEITDFFISLAGLNVVQHVATMVKPQKLEDIFFSEIEDIIMEKIRPKKKLIIVERAHFMQLNQTAEESISEYDQQLRKAAQFCEFNNDAKQSAKDDLLQI